MRPVMGPCRFRVIFDVVIHVVVPGRSLDSSTAVIKSTAIVIYRKARINVCICCRCYDRLLEALQWVEEASTACRFRYRSHQWEIGTAYQSVVTGLNARYLGRTHRHPGILFEALDKVAQQAAAAGDNDASGQIFVFKSGKYSYP